MYNYLSSEVNDSISSPLVYGTRFGLGSRFMSGTIASVSYRVRRPTQTVNQLPVSRIAITTFVCRICTLSIVPSLYKLQTDDNYKNVIDSIQQNFFFLFYS